MNIGVDASALGMASAVTSHTSNVYATYWNPAGLLEIEDNQLALMHSSYFSGIANYDYAAYAMPLDSRSAVGVSLIRFAVDNIIDTRALIDSGGNITPYENLPRFSNADYGLSLSYARSLPLQGLNYGVNAKIIRRVIGDFASAWGFGFDLGVQFKTANHWAFGLMARDITTTFNAWAIDDDIFDNIADDIPEQERPQTTEITIPKLQIGISKTINFHNEYSLLTAMNINMRFEENNAIISNKFVSINPALGFEFSYINMVYLRTGIGNFQKELQLDNSINTTFQPSFGVGFKYNGIQIDYAFTDIGDQSVALYSNVFSMKLDFSIFR